MLGQSEWPAALSSLYMTKAKQKVARLKLTVISSHLCSRQFSALKLKASLPWMKVICLTATGINGLKQPELLRPRRDLWKAKFGFTRQRHKIRDRRQG